MRVPGVDDKEKRKELIGALLDLGGAAFLADAIDAADLEMVLMAVLSDDAEFQETYEFILRKLPEEVWWPDI